MGGAQIVQPEGPSFNVTGNHVEWQQWSFHVGFNYREGLVLNHIGCATRPPPFLRPHPHACGCQWSDTLFPNCAS